MKLTQSILIAGLCLALSLNACAAPASQGPVETFK
jgi:hypothetical protein